MVLPYLNYCNLVWGSSYKTNLPINIILQKSVIRIVKKSNYDAHVETIFKKLNLFKFHDIYLVQLGQFIFPFNNHILPRKFENTFLRNTQIHDTTQGMQIPSVDICRINIRQFSVFYQGPQFFNSLTPKITGPSSVASYRKKKVLYQQLLILLYIPNVLALLTRYLPYMLSKLFILFVL